MLIALLLQASPLFEASESAARQERDRQVARVAQQQADALAIQNDKASLPARVGSLVAAGKCDKAEREALQGGDFQLAENAKAYCLAHPVAAK